MDTHIIIILVAILGVVGALVGALSSIAGVLIGSFFSFLTSRRQFQSTVISNKRQEWINTLRDTISEFQSVLVSLNFFIDTTGKFNEEKQKEYQVIIQKVAFLRSKINLLINPVENDHKELSDLTRNALDMVTKRDMKKLDECMTGLTSVGQRILKHEWERVKEGK
ncbi:MAG: hypothetical protein RIG61_06400 [Deltaproteobacteria bacterium]